MEILNFMKKANEDMISNLNDMVAAQVPMAYLLKNNKKITEIIVRMNTKRESLKGDFNFIERGLFDESCKVNEKVIKHYETMVANSNTLLKSFLAVQIQLTKEKDFKNENLILEIKDSETNDYYVKKILELKEKLSELEESKVEHIIASY